MPVSESSITYSKNILYMFLYVYNYICLLRTYTSINNKYIELDFG